MRNSVLLLCASLILAGCQSGVAPTAAEKHGAPAAGAAVEIEDPLGKEALADLILDVQRAAQLSSEEQKREVTNMNQTLARERGDRATLARIRLATMLSMPGTSVQDDLRAQSLLEPYANAGTNASVVRQFGAFSYSQIAERVRGTRRAEQLKDQLDALRAVERSIIERGQMPTPRKK